MAEAGSTAPPSVLDKAAALMRALACDDTEPPLGLSELSRASGLSKATTHRLATELVGHGLLERSDDGYRLGPWLFELGQRVPRFYDIARVAAPFCEDLHRATGQTVHFAVRDGYEIIYLMKVRDHRGIDRPSRVAGRMPAHCTASGRALLSIEPEEVLEEVIAAGLEPRTSRTLVHPPALRELVDEARETGLAAETEEVQLGMGAIASPVFGRRGAVGAIGVGHYLRDGRPERFGTAVRTSALYLSRMLSRSPADGR